MFTNKLSNTLMIAFLSLTFLIITAKAQNEGQSLAEKYAAQATERMKSELNLTASQVPKVHQANLTAARSVADWVKKYLGDPSANKKEMVTSALSVSKQYESQLQGILGPSQWSTYLKKKAERNAKMLTQMMTMRYDLTEEQASEVEKINLDAALKIQNAMNQSQDSKNPVQKAVNPIQKMWRDKTFKPILEEREQALQKVLTADQWKSHEQYKMEMREILSKMMQERT